MDIINLFKPIQHNTLVDVVLYLSFVCLPLMGELRLALATTKLWWGGSGDKSFVRQILFAVVVMVLNLPTALYLGCIINKYLSIAKV